MVGLVVILVGSPTDGLDWLKLPVVVASPAVVNSGTGVLVAVMESVVVTALGVALENSNVAAALFAGITTLNPHRCTGVGAAEIKSLAGLHC